MEKQVLAFCMFLSLSAASGAQVWRTSDQTDPITKEKQVFSILGAKDWDKKYGFNSQKGPELVLICRNKRLEAYVEWSALISCGDINVEYRLPNGRIVKARWLAATDCKANFVKNAKDFMRSINVGGEVPLRYTPRTGSITVIDWNFPKSDDLKAKYPEVCRW